MVRTFIYLAILLASASLFADVKGIKVVETKSAPLEIYENSHALLIGASNYSSAWPDLVTVPAELAKLEKVLIQQQFSITKVLNPTSEELEDAFENFIDKHGYDPKNRLLFYFSGHGFTRASGTKGYLVPTDAPHPNKDETNFVRSAFSMTSLLALAREIESTHALFLFDSCFSGTIFKTRSLPSSPPLITSLTRKPVRQFITAGDAGEAVPAKSIFTPAITDGLEHGLADLNEDGFVTGSELGMYLQSTISKASSGAQSPQYGKINDYDLSLGDFVFQVPTEEKVESPAPEVVQYQDSDFSLSDLKEIADKNRKRREEELIDAFRETENFVNSTTNKNLQSTAWNRFVENFQDSATLGSEGVSLLAIAEEKLLQINSVETRASAIDTATEDASFKTNSRIQTEPKQEKQENTEVSFNSAALPKLVNELEEKSSKKRLEEKPSIISSKPVQNTLRAAGTVAEDQNQKVQTTVSSSIFSRLKFYSDKASIFTTLMVNLDSSIIAQTFPREFSDLKSSVTSDNSLEIFERFVKKILAEKVEVRGQDIKIEAESIIQLVELITQKTPIKEVSKKQIKLADDTSLNSLLFSLSTRTLYVSAFSQEKLQGRSLFGWKNELKGDKKILLDTIVDFLIKNEDIIDIKRRISLVHFIVKQEASLIKWAAVSDWLMRLNAEVLANNSSVEKTDKIKLLSLYGTHFARRSIEGRRSRSAYFGLRVIAETFWDQAIELSLDQNSRHSVLTLIPLKMQLEFCFTTGCSTEESSASIANKIYDIATRQELPLPKQLEAKLQLADSYLIDGRIKEAEKTYLNYWTTINNTDVELSARISKTEPVLLGPINIFAETIFEGDLPSPIPFKIKVGKTGKVVRVKSESKSKIRRSLETVIKRKLARAVFRPALVLGKPVASEIVHIQKFVN